GSAEKLDVAREHGADYTINYRQEDLREAVKSLTGGRGADVVFDPVGGKIFESSLRATAWGGRLVIIGFAAGEVQQVPANILLVKNVAALGFYWGSYRKHAPSQLQAQFQELVHCAEEGRLRARVSHRPPLARGAAALRLLENRVAKGTVGLEMKDRPARAHFAGTASRKGRDTSPSAAEYPSEWRHPLSRTRRRALVAGATDTPAGRSPPRKGIRLCQARKPAAALRQRREPDEAGVPAPAPPARLGRLPRGLLS